MNLNQEQLEIVNSNKPYVVVNASAAAGKTATLTERVRHLSKLNIPKEKIVVITFTNMAAEEMSLRLGEDGYGIFIGTIHSYANYLLLSSGYDTSNIISEEEFDKLFEKVEEHLDCIRDVDHLLLDEAQDTGELEWKFIFDMIKPKNYMIFGDLKQSIYRWKSAKPELLYDLSQQKDVTNYSLYKNYRNGKDILSFAKNIIRKGEFNYRDNSQSCASIDGKVFLIEYNLDNIINFIEKSILQGDNYKDWFILCRTNAQVDEVCQKFEKNNIPNDTFKRAELTYHTLQEKLDDDTVKILTIHCSKGMEAKNVVVIGQRFYNDEEICISYVAATRAKNMLFWTKTKNKKKKIKIHKF